MLLLVEYSLKSCLQGQLNARMEDEANPDITWTINIQSLDGNISQCDPKDLEVCVYC